ncbi:hypothetical protein [Aulosira sp. FACHB-615]|uniref:hypothetical protein n=1 Tax=Aulosira sp. FACHB-615 TaxID=2692777 RepID=UPI001A7EABB5|nr:hypothetical protein [Aulosira sp. FACHB-615]
MDWNTFLVESSEDDLRYETRNSFRGGTDALNEHFTERVSRLEATGVRGLERSFKPKLHIA